MRRSIIYCFMICFTIFVVLISIFAPGQFNGDSKILNQVYTIYDEDTSQRYRYSLDIQQRIHVLSMALNNRNRLQSEFSMLLREMPSSTFAFIINHKGPSSNEISYENVIEILSSQLFLLEDNEIIPKSSFELSDKPEITLYTAVDVSDPRRNVSVWQVSVGNIEEAYLDAEIGKIYSFSMRTQIPPKHFEPEAMIHKWCEYLGIGPPRLSNNDSLTNQETPYHKQYDIGTLNDIITYTVGYYEGVNEIYIKNYE